MYLEWIKERGLRLFLVPDNDRTDEIIYEACCSYLPLIRIISPRLDLLKKLIITRPEAINYIDKKLYYEIFLLNPELCRDLTNRQVIATIPTLLAKSMLYILEHDVRYNNRISPYLEWLLDNTRDCLDHKLDYNTIARVARLNTRIRKNPTI